MTPQAYFDLMTKSQTLADAGQHAAVAGLLSREADDVIKSSATLALVFGISLGRLGRYQSAATWIRSALHRARQTGDRTVEARSLNVLGAIAIESGFVDDAIQHLSQGIEIARLTDDHTTMGRCANNLGIIASLRGDYCGAVSSFTRALVAFDRGGSQHGLAETLANTAITYRDQAEYHRALDYADQAVHGAEATDDLSLVAQTWACRAEVRLRAGDAPLARREAETALTTHRQIHDIVGEAEDLRVLALTLFDMGDWAGAEQTLRSVLDRAEQLRRPLLSATTNRDLARILSETGRWEEAREIGQRARVQFNRLGAVAEAFKLDDLAMAGQEIGGWQA
jgi:tetratricopeptide (TPR) repeat protein